MSVSFPIYSDAERAQIAKEEAEYRMYSTGRFVREYDVARKAKEFVDRGVSYATAVRWADAEINCITSRDEGSTYYSGQEVDDD